MKENLKLALIVSWIILIGMPILFLTVSIFTGDWRYVMISIGPSLAAGLTGLILTKQKIKQNKQFT